MQMSPVIAVHMTASLIALVIGPIAMWARLGQTKRPWIQRAIGYGWVSMMIVSAVSAIFIRDYGLPNIWGYTPIHLLIPFTAFWLVYGFRALAMKEIEKHRKAMIGLYLGACIGAGSFTLLPSRYLGGIVWSYFGLIN
jgi:uncharacterized membrane protein